MPLPPSYIRACECAAISCIFLKNNGEVKNLVFMGVISAIEYCTYLMRDILQLEKQEKPAALCSVRGWL